MEGYLIRIPHDAWLGGNDRSNDTSGSNPRLGASKRRVAQAQLLYYVLGEGFLRGYASPDDDEPVDSFQLTSFHVQVDPMYSMLLFEVFAKNKGADVVPVPADRTKASEDDSSDESDTENDDTGAQDTSSKVQEPSILLFAANKTLIQTWGSRVLNWNRYVFDSFADNDDSDEPDKEAHEASRLELLQAFQQHQCASWFARPLSLKSSGLQAETAARRSKTGASLTSFSSNGPVPVTPTKSVESTERGVQNPASKPWWMLNASQTRRISSNSLRK